MILYISLFMGLFKLRRKIKDILYSIFILPEQRGTIVFDSRNTDQRRC